MSYNLTHLHDLLSQKLGMSTINTYSIADLEKKIKENTELRVNRMLDSKIATAYAMAKEDLKQERASQSVIDKDNKTISAQRLQDILHTDWDDMTEESRTSVIQRWKRDFPNYTTDRDLLYSNLISNRVGTPYAHINNLNAVLSSYGRPIKSSLSQTSDADYYYDFVIPRSAAVLWWYERANVNLSQLNRLKWYNRIYVPNIMDSTANLGEEIENKAENIVGEARSDVKAGLNTVSEGLGNTKYLIAGTAALGIVSFALISRK